MNTRNKILWVDDEIELLRSHIIFLSEKGYNVDTVTNGEDAIDKVREQNFDLIFLDEMMSGLGGLETLAQIKDINPYIPVVMVTKNEEESLMNDAIGSKISDYLIKPVVPSQILLVCKKILEREKISSEYTTKDYLQDFNNTTRQLFDDPDYKDWINIYTRLVNWEMEIEGHPEVNLKQTLTDQKKELNKEFSRYVERNYVKWINNEDKDNRPIITTDVMNDYVFKYVKNETGPIFFFVLDCLRLDQWMLMEKQLLNIFNINKDYYYSILPTATPYARNALFSGLFPLEIQQILPQYWSDRGDEKSQNKYERELLDALIKRKRINLKNDFKYLKIIDPEVGRSFEQNVLSFANTHLITVVVNFLDMIAHGRSDSELLKEIAPDEAAYRSLSNSWFKHSYLLSTFKSIAKIPGAKIIISTDHGSIRTQRGSKVLGDKEASKNLRFKFGRNLKAEDKHSIFIKKPEEYKLPHVGVAANYIIAKEDYYFVYPTEYHKYLSHYKDTFQHGGISLEEMILPIVTLTPK
ncbi:MAG: response regulator [Melioribacteraceae bacterium]|nr:response regulator [Melioribacteraceae bacterium]